MREIKFRAWQKDGKRNMLYSEDKNDGKNYLYLFFGLIDYESFEIMQFTGLHDKNGKEIYEGDIIKMTAEVNPNCEVIFFQGVFGIFRGNGRHYPLRDFTNTGTSISERAIDLEVIGNIYSNPELIK